MHNILHVVNIYFVIPYFLGDQLLFFREKGYKEYIICSPSDEIKHYAKSHLFNYKEVSIERKISIWKDSKAILSTCRYIHKENITIVTGHTPKGALIAMIASFIMGTPIRIYFRHGLVYETATGFKRKLLVWMDRLTSKLATKIVCVSPSICKKSIEDHLNPFNKQLLLSKGTCNGIDISKFNRTTLNEEQVRVLKNKLGLDKYTFVIGFTGRLVRDKGIIELVQAFKILSKRYDKVALLLVGMLEERDALPIEIIEYIRMNPAIISTGYVESSKIEYYYALMDVFVLPSYREGFPTSILEASSMQLPVVTTKVTGCIDAIIKDETGTFVENDSLDITSAIEKYAINKELSKKHGSNGRKFVEKNFDQHLIWNEIEKLYLK